MMKDATLKQWSELCVHYAYQRRMLKANYYGENQRLAEKWTRLTLLKIKILMANGSYVRKLL